MSGWGGQVSPRDWSGPTSTSLSSSSTGPCPAQLPVAGAIQMSGVGWGGVGWGWAGVWGAGLGRGPGNGEQERQVGSSGCGAPRVRKELPPVCDRQATSEGKGGGGRAAQRCVQIPASLAVGPWANALISLNLRFFSSQKPKLRREGGARKAPEEAQQEA